MWRNPSHPPPEPRPAPQETGHRLATIPRGPGEELRLSLDTFEGRPYVNVRVWAIGSDGAYWPVRGKGVSVRIREIRAVAEALARAYDLTEGGDPSPAAPTRARSRAPSRATSPANRAIQQPPARQLPGPPGHDLQFDEFGDSA